MKKTESLLRFLQDKNARRKGLGIEIALLVLLAVFAMSTLLVSTAVLERDGMNSRSDETLERLALDQIGENYLTSKTMPGEDTGYKISDFENGNFAVLTVAGELKLDVKTQDGKITGWTYHNLGNGGQ